MDTPSEKGPLLAGVVSQEAVAISFICLLDLLTTLYWVSQGRAREGNPVMAFFLDQGPVPFIIAKMCAFVPAVVAAEWYRRRKPVFVTRLLRWVIVGYFVLWLAGVFAHVGQAGEFYHRLLMGTDS